MIERNDKGVKIVVSEGDLIDFSVLELFLESEFGIKDEESFSIEEEMLFVPVSGLGDDINCTYEHSLWFWDMIKS